MISLRRRAISSIYLLYVNGKANVIQQMLFEEKKNSPVSRNFFKRKKRVFKPETAETPSHSIRINKYKLVSTVLQFSIISLCE